jgi:hypothetical protein
VVTVPDAVVYKNTMVVKLLDTAITEVAMICFFRPQSFARDAHIVQVVVFFNQSIEQLLEIRLFLDIARVNHSEGVEYNGGEEEKRNENKAEQLQLILSMLSVVCYSCEKKHEHHK